MSYSELPRSKAGERHGVDILPGYCFVQFCINKATAVDKLNASMCFEPTAVQSKMAFKQTGIDYDLFDYIRGTLFNYSVLTETIAISDLLLYTLMLLTRHPEISIEFKKKCKLLLVDEAQDLTLISGLTFTHSQQPVIF